MNTVTSDLTQLNEDQLLELDRKHVWHPYTAANSLDPIFPVERAEGSRIILKNGKTLIDGMASWWSVIHGYNHPQLNAALQEQAEKFAHVMFGGFTHEPATVLAKQLSDLAPDGLNRVFFSDSGSVAVEVAMKMAIQFMHSRGQNGPKREKFLALRNGYHGDTFAAMSVCDPYTGMHQLFDGILPRQIFADAPQCGFDMPWEDHYFDNFEQQFLKHASSLAAVILEPIVQGAGGMRFYSAEFLKRVKKLCVEHDVLLIADEIATGLGRTGKMFACEHADICPDILCLGKTLTAGYITLAATLCTDEVAKGIDQSEPGVLMHGPTYMANPLACAVARKSIELLTESNWQKKISDIHEIFSHELQAANSLSLVNEVRSLGGIGVIELKTPVKLAEIQQKLVDEGIWLRPFGKLVYSIPSYSIDPEDLVYLCQKTIKVLKNLS